MQQFSNPQAPDIQVLFSQFLATLSPAVLAQLAPSDDGRINLRTEVRTHLTTAEAAQATNRRPQTLRGWHCEGKFPIPEIRPLVINGKLAWPVAGLRKLMGV